ncbi:hypothetical protein EV177_006739 [Coemansia sp. RSA 1804]|nr:hypothetical protein EV177_006739 [Coemansia sp. RSA 1804]
MSNTDEHSESTELTRLLTALIQRQEERDKRMENLLTTLTQRQAERDKRMEERDKRMEERDKRMENLLTTLTQRQEERDKKMEEHFSEIHGLLKPTDRLTSNVVYSEKIEPNTNTPLPSVGVME